MKYYYNNSQTAETSVVGDLLVCSCSRPCDTISRCWLPTTAITARSGEKGAGGFLRETTYSSISYLLKININKILVCRNNNNNNMDYGCCTAARCKGWPSAKTRNIQLVPYIGVCIYYIYS